MIKFKYRTLFFTVLLIFYTGYAIKKWSILEKSGLRFDPFYLYCSSAIMIVFILVYSLVLRLQLIVSDPTISYKTFTVIQTGAWLSRYIPGMTGVLGGKVYFGSRAGISREKMFQAGFNEQVLDFFISIFLILISTIYFFSNKNISMIYSFVILLFLIILSLKWNLIVSRIFSFMYSKELSEEESQKLAMFDITVIKRYLIVSFLIISRLLYILTAFFLLKAFFYKNNLKLIVICILAESLSKLTGQFLIKLPSEIGIKEIILIVLMIGTASIEVILIAVFSMRLWHTFMDFISFFYYFKNRNLK